ncbi:Asp-tRNA(Asn)/Glu-tRNA(Gln) amidotransferase GatCAB subunit B [bacterium (Candidatus Gribaldobacteria) CG23_combo_of_CG06-09_8_20_14_all_37_87_8]|uniref:Aspartyl/glutamyl-tRNA(Asn/Gln) amidotransferase subunit B n=2 Tax=Candidatus Gribaldobacteria TaxID=2798536 RepID=A0A2G9ZFG0_9BACT|nr:MAG: Asp-tRNA(Asn)/Glu-tRNA(Gln) amidotransferase GatCAB subunit B [bacterium (Candidatus Gribaldobacteria) CG23_combo_of_CG06-09_8_20_14_all_37_87_8]PIR90378.1 MAG: Asp-tRNA(Asn)/Glu-tRNA(Gln) amidotransferase subunit GatB [bacterium (Candidatus Gribaldobacteria) CG10_big_fil_rev_8_21_14_0_10_37_21]
MKYFPTIGLEIHIELNTQTKMFCCCKNDSNETKPNQNICEVCTAQPGTLPVANETAIKQLLKTAIALNCEVCDFNRFERKNYFYPDLPKGYQISQYALPMARNGFLDIAVSIENSPRNDQSQNQNDEKKANDHFFKAQTKKVRIERIHLEEDTGRLLHESDEYSLVDLNRAGVPLMELVTEPDIHSATEAREFIKELQLLLRYLNVSTADMEKGEMRCEVNISIVGEGSDKLGTKVEIKNLNSIRSVEKSIEYEIKRQSEVLNQGEKVIQETRGFHDAKQITFSQRSKEQAHDYRYFPEPDLLPISFTEDYLLSIKAEVPELPQAKRERFQREFDLSFKEADLYVSQPDLGNYFEKVVSELEKKEQIKLASNYLSTDLQALLKENQGPGLKGSRDRVSVTAENFAEFIGLIASGVISSKMAKELLFEMFQTGAGPSQIIESKGLKQIGNEQEIEKIAQEVIKENQQPANDYKAGKKASLQFLVGRLMAKSDGKANPQLAISVLKDILS